MDDGLIRDGTLGPVLWDEERRWWRFRVGAFGGRRVMGYIFPTDQAVPMSGVVFEAIRGHVAWIRENEPAMLNLVVDRMYSWWQRTEWAEELRSSITNSELFREQLHLECVHFKGDVAEVGYGTGDLMNAHSFWIIFDRPGLLPEKVMWG